MEDALDLFDMGCRSWFFAGFRDDWVASTWRGHLVLGAPLGDLVWSALFGAAHPTALLLALRTAR